MTKIIKPKRLKHCNSLLKGMLVVLLSIFSTLTMYSQDITVSGTVRDKNGDALPGASIVVKGTDRGIITDIDGNFTVSVPGKNSVLVVTFVGYLSEEITVGDQTTIDVVLVDDIQEMNEVVVIGYGTQKKSDLTGSIASVSSEELNAIPVARVDEALVGRAAGVNVTATSGMPGASRTIQIRGVSSINGFEPLVVIDGIPGGDMNKISPSEIESIEILKDAASAAIYGSSGGNGVILITTKKGAVGKPTTRVNMYVGMQELASKIEMMDTRQWNQFYAAKNEGRPYIFSEDSLNLYTDWQDAVYKSAPMKSIDINTTGGTEKLKYSLSTNYVNQNGMVKNTGYEKLVISLNSVFQLTDRIKFDEVIRFSNDKTTGPAEWQYQNVYNNFTTLPAILMVPFLEPYQEDGSWSTASGLKARNPVVGMDRRSNQYNKYVNIHGNFGLEIELIKGLTYTSRFSGTIGSNEYWSFLPEYYSWEEDFNALSRLDQTWRKDYSWTFQNYATYNFTLADMHEISLLAGMEAKNYWDYDIGGYRQEYSSNNPDLLYFKNSLDENTPGQIIGGSGKEAKALAYFGRVNYDFNNLILAQVNYRYDGHSNFGPNNRFGPFPSGSVGFKFSELSVIKDLGFISFGKIRFGYGETGQFSVTNYWPYNSSILNTAQMNYAFDDATISSGQGPVQIPNPDLKWEKVVTTNYGLDMAFFANQLKLTVDYFNKVNDGMIMDQPVSSIAGTYISQQGNPGELGETGISTTNPIVNFGSVSNRGIETTIDFIKQFNDFKITAGVNFTSQMNEITELAQDSTTPAGASVHDINQITINKVGQSIGTFRGYQYDGLFKVDDPMVFNTKSNRYVFVDQPFTVSEEGDTTFARPRALPGDAKWVDKNGDGAYSPADHVYLGSYIPKYVFGFNVRMEYKGIDFSMFWQGVAGNKIFNGIKRWTYDWQTLTNHAAEFADRYHEPVIYEGVVIDPGNLESDLPNMGVATWGVPSSLYIEDGSYLRLRTATLGYTLPENWTNKVQLGSVRFYVNGKNLVTFTKYTGYDPEISNRDPRIAGIDIGGYPQSRMYTVGVNVEF